MGPANVARRRSSLLEEAIASALEESGFRLELRRGDGWSELLAVADDPAVRSHPRRLAVNPAPAVRRVQSSQEWALLLRLHGIPVAFEHLPPEVPRPVHPPAQGEFVPIRVHVGDLQILSTEDDQVRAKGISLPAWRHQRLMEAACRSVYLLGLHFAAVSLRVHPAGGWHVAHVDPFPDVGEVLSLAYGERVARLVQSRLGGEEERGETLLGADPEFLMASDHGKILYASNYVKHRGIVGYDRQSRAHRGRVYPLVEVRPPPSPSPIVLAKNTERALAKAAELLPTRRTRWMAGSYPLGEYPTGGHIHFSGLPLTTPVLRALDNYLALPVMLLEDRLRSRQRRKKYGRLGDFRRKEHGGFEYRALPSWLVSKEAARAVLCLAKVVAAEWPALAQAPLAALPSVRQFYQGRKTQLRRYFAPLWRRLLATRTGKQYRYELEYFARSVARGTEWNDESDLKRAWWD